MRVRIPPVAFPPYAETTPGGKGGTSFELSAISIPLHRLCSSLDRLRSFLPCSTTPWAVSRNGGTSSLPVSRLLLFSAFPFPPLHFSSMNAGISITRTNEALGEKSLKVEIAVETVKVAEEKAASYYAKRGKVKGFRKGKIPLNIVRQRFKDAIRESALRDLIGKSWKAALEQEELEPIGDPRVRDLKFEVDSPVTFEFHVEVKPDITLDRVGGFTLTRETKPVTDEMVNAQLDEVRRQRAPWVPVGSEKPKLGHLVNVSIATLRDGEPSDEKSYQLVLGQGDAIAQVEEQIMTMIPGETKDTTVKFPDDHPDESLRGQNRSSRITVDEVKRQELPELNDDFAREVGDFDSLAELEKAVRDDLEKEAAREAEAEIRRQLIDQMALANGLEAPRPMVNRLIAAYAQAYEIPQERVPSFAAEFTPIAQARVKRDLILDYVAEKEGLRATEEDVEERVKRIAERRNAEVGQVHASLEKNDRLSELRRNITEEKVFSYLMEQCTIRDQ